MKCLNRNKVRFFYALYEKEVPVLDEYGNDTGEHDVIHGDPIECFANVSAAKGETSARQFGENESYDKVVVMDNTETPIDEHTILWVDTLPTLDENGATSTPHDYVVKNLARSLNSVSIAISKVKVDG